VLVTAATETALSHCCLSFSSFKKSVYFFTPTWRRLYSSHSSQFIPLKCY